MLKLINKLIKAYYPCKVDFIAGRKGESHSYIMADVCTEIKVQMLEGKVRVDLLVNDNICDTDYISLVGADNLAMRHRTKDIIHNMMYDSSRKIGFNEMEYLLEDMARIEPRFNHFYQQAMNVCGAAKVMPLTTYMVKELWFFNNIHCKACPLMRSLDVAAEVVTLPIEVQDVTPFEIMLIEGAE